MIIEKPDLEPEYELVVVGASVSGVAAAETFVNASSVGRVLLVDKDRELPHDKPPLSKLLFTDGWEPHTVHFRRRLEWEETSRIHLCLGEEARLTSDDRLVDIDDQNVRAGSVVAASGCSPRMLPQFTGASNVCALRSLADAVWLRTRVATAHRIVLIGAGFIGLEAASALRAVEREVDVVEAAELPMERLIGSDAAAWILARHRAAGVRFHCSRQAAGAAYGPDGDITSLVLDNGLELQCDLVLIGIGVSPVTAWTIAGSVELDDGVICDRRLQTAATGVFAAGDVARVASTPNRPPRRSEHWSAAVAQGKLAGSNAAAYLRQGRLEPLHHVSYVWSDQFGSRIQLVGDLDVSDKTEVREMSDARLVVGYSEGGRLVGGLGVGAAREMMALRRRLSLSAQLAL